MKKKRSKESKRCRNNGTQKPRNTMRVKETEKKKANEKDANEVKRALCVCLCARQTEENLHVYNEYSQISLSFSSLSDVENDEYAHASFSSCEREKQNDKLGWTKNKHAWGIQNTILKKKASQRCCLLT
jgi:hypothetical protein